jgi:hypothetical protein
MVVKSLRSEDSKRRRPSSLKIKGKDPTAWLFGSSSASFRQMQGLDEHGPPCSGTHQYYS